MKTVEIDVEVLESMFENIEYLHALVNKVLNLLTAKAPDDLLTSQETAKLLRVSPATLHNLKVYGKIPFIQIEGRVMYQASDIAKFLMKQKIEASP